MALKATGFVLMHVIILVVWQLIWFLGLMSVFCAAEAIVLMLGINNDYNKSPQQESKLFCMLYQWKS